MRGEKRQIIKWELKELNMKRNKTTDENKKEANWGKREQEIQLERRGDNNREKNQTNDKEHKMSQICEDREPEIRIKWYGNKEKKRTKLEKRGSQK